MSDHLLPYLANCSLLFTEEPLLRRPAAARAAGFGAVEFWWPFATPVPSDREVDAFTTAIEEAGVALAGPELLRRRPGRPGLRRAVDSRAQRGVPRQHRRGGRHRRAAGRARVQRAVREPGRRRGPGGPGRAGGGEHRAGGEGRGRLRRHGADRAGERAEALSAAHRRRRGGRGPARPRGGRRQRRLPVRPVPPGQQRRRHRRRDRRVRRVRRARADRRRARPRRAGQRPARPGPVPGRAGRPRLPGLGKPGVQAHRDDRGEPGLAAQGAPAATDGRRSSHEHADRVHRAGHHGRADGRQPGQGRFRGHRVQPQPGQGRAARRGGRPRRQGHRRGGPGGRRGGHHGARLPRRRAGPGRRGRRLRDTRRPGR